MVEQQIRPWDVLDFDILDALEGDRARTFCRRGFSGLAYADMELPLTNGHKMLEPKVVCPPGSRLETEKDETVLEIGTGSGYATALLSKLAGKVVTDDIDAEQQQRAKKFWTGGLYQRRLCAKQRPDRSIARRSFDAIYVGGAVDSVPEILKSN